MLQIRSGPTFSKTFLQPAVVSLPDFFDQTAKHFSVAGTIKKVNVIFIV